jgi:HK97 family phage major capsid protein/HK97 family phage prohead protease
VSQPLTRAYSLLEIRSVSEDQRIIEGIASTPSTDRMGDIVEPKGATFTLPIPLLWQHDGKSPIGEVFAAKVTPEGISVKARIAKSDTPGTLKDRLDEAWDSMKLGLVKGLSVGFQSIESARIDGTFGVRFLKWAWLELSAVTIPANAEASILSIKAAHLAATGNGDGPTSPGVSGTRAVKTARASMTITEQIKDFQAQRVAKSARMNELMDAVAKKGETLDESGTQEYDGLENEVKAIDSHLTRLERLEKANAAAARPVDADTPAKAAASRDPHVPVVRLGADNAPIGIGFARSVMCQVQARMDGYGVMDVAKARYPHDVALHNFLQMKATVPAGTTQQAVYAGPLVYADNLASQFVEFLQPQTVLGKFGMNGIPSLTRVPFNVRVPSQTSDGFAAWVGEGAGKPVTSAAFSSISVSFAKVATIAVLTKELVRLSSPSAEMLVRNMLANAIIKKIDTSFIDPAFAAVANVNPASITHGLVALTSAGTSADNARTDLAQILKKYLEQNQNPTGLVFIMPPALAMVLSLMRNSLGQKEFPDISATGGTLEGFPVITSQHAANESGGGNLVIAVRAADIFLADDGVVSIDASEQASVQMSDAPTINSTTGTGASLVSLWQTNSVGIRAEREITWTKARSTAVVYMDDVNWGSVGSPA